MLKFNYGFISYTQDKEIKVGDTDDAENEKDTTTEKEQQNQPQIEGGDNIKTEVATDATAAAAPTENGTSDETEQLDESKLSETATAAAGDETAATEATGDSNKKPKKSKKKWSFRSFSFSKKDKQKPVKKDEAAAAATNGECEKVPEEVSHIVLLLLLQISDNFNIKRSAYIFHSRQIMFPC